MYEWTPEICEPENVADGFAVAVEKGQIVVNLNKGNAGPFAKTILYFLRANHGNTCQVEVRGTRVNLGDGQELQLPCTLRF